MGIYVNLRVWRDAIDRAAWNEAYDETLRLLRAHRSQLLGHSPRELLGRDVLVYTRQLERRVNGRTEWCVVGDRASMRFGESFHFVRDDSTGFRSRSAASAIGEDDIVFAWPRDSRGGFEIFGNKTQGEPYHIPIVAAAMVVESRFPQAALAWGDLSETDIERAKAFAEEALGREIARPVLYDAPRLFERLRAKFCGTELLGAFAKRFCGEISSGLARVIGLCPEADVEAFVRESLARLSPQQVEEHLDDAMGDASSGDDTGEPPDVVGIAPSIVLRAFLLGGGSLARLCALAAELWAAGALDDKAFASALVDTGALLSAETQARIERCKSASLPRRSDVALAVHAMGALFLDAQDWCGLAIPPPQMVSALKVVFLDRTAELWAHIKKRTRSQEKALLDLCILMEGEASFAEGLEPYQELGDLIATRSPEELLPSARKRLMRFAYLITLVRRSPRRKLPAMTDNPAMARSFFVVSARRTGHLTEDAWEWLLREEDPSVLRLLVDLFSFEAVDAEADTLKRALLENRFLCEEVVRMLSDNALMEEAEALTKQRPEREAPEPRSTDWN